MSIRAFFSRLFLHAMEKHTPQAVRRFEIRVLTGLTARAFRREPVHIPLLFGSADEALRKYAQFTRQCMESAGPDVDPRRLYALSRRLGRRLRLLSGFSRGRDCERLLFWLYRNIGIRMTGSVPGRITVHACFFSRFYDPRQCALMSHMDSGMAAGICQVKGLRFCRRITQGCKSCAACSAQRGK